MFPINEAQKQADLAWANEYVKHQQWREAVTYRKTTPHEYIVVRRSDVGRDDFKRMFELIEKYGQVERFFGKPYTYLFLDDGYKYFAADGGGWQEDRYILNRAKADVTYGKQD